MPTIAISLLTGGFVLHTLPGLPAWPVFAALLILSLVLCIRPAFHVLAGFLAGFSVSGLAAGSQLSERLDPDREMETVAMTAVVTSFPASRGGAAAFVVRPEPPAALPTGIRLSWFEPAVIPQLGETWRLEVRLRRPAGFANPGGFDLERWLFQQRIGATGYVIENGNNYPIRGSPVGPLDRIRRHVVLQIAAQFGGTDAAAVMMAIVVGARHRISREGWDAYAQTGTSHLMAISGLHVGLAAGSAFALCWCIASLIPGVRNLRDCALLAALATATTYAAMSGFAVPAQRACIMLAIAVTLALYRRETRVANVLGATVLLVMLIDPLSILAPGFKLSFAAVAILFSVSRQFVRPPGTRAIVGRLRGITRLWSIQLALLAGLMPLTISLFERFAAFAPIINLLVLPVFNFVTVPFSLLGALFAAPLAAVGALMFSVAHGSIEWVLYLIDRARSIDALPHVASIPVPLPLLLLPLLYVVLPAGWPCRRLSFLAAVACLQTSAAPTPGRCFDYHVLDVGQGLAVLIETRDYAMLFDTGPAFRSGSDTAELVILPFLARRGIRRLDIVVVSHADLDHSGGLATLIRRLRVGRVLAGERIPFLGRAQESCSDALHWHWNGVDFRVLHPRPGTPWRGNNASCMLEVSAGSSRLLLTGDIESPVEILLGHRKILRPVYALTVPHHGSRTSSTHALVDATRPAVAIVSAGRSNRWGFPKPDVAERWRETGARVFNTATSGALGQRLCADRLPEAVVEARQTRKRYWHDP